MANEIQVVGIKEVESLIIELRGQKVLLDRDVAALYGVETRHVNQAVRNNPEKFPEGFIFDLIDKEIQYLRSKNSTANLSVKTRSVPKAFTERGLYMLATILKSPRATQTTIAIINSFTQIREFSRCVHAIPQEPDQKKQKSLLERSGELLADLLDTDGVVTESESTVELNLAVLKIKRTVKKTTKK